MSEKQCSNCSRWCANQRSLMLHLASCPKKYKDSASHLNQSHYDYQPLKTSYEKYSDDNNFHFANSGSNELDTDDSVSHTDSAFTISDNESVIHDKTNDDQCSTAVSKVQIKLNHLINRHKAPLKLYDDIVVLFNDYISSPNLDWENKNRPQYHHLANILIFP